MATQHAPLPPPLAPPVENGPEALGPALSRHGRYLAFRPDLLRLADDHLVFFDEEEDELCAGAPGYARDFERAGYEFVGTVAACRHYLTGGAPVEEPS